MKLQRRFSITLIVVVIFLLLAILAGYLFLKTREESRREENLTPKATQPRPIPGSAQFSNEKYINALEDNTTGSIYSTKAQMRGVVLSWTKKTLLKKRALVVSVGEKEFSIDLPNEVELLCLPLTKIAEDGTTYKMSAVYLGLEKAEGQTVDSEDVIQKIPEGADITLQVNVDKNNNMEADFIVGYGCSID